MARRGEGANPRWAWTETALAGQVGVGGGEYWAASGGRVECWAVVAEVTVGPRRWRA